jgi:hypothetical protein
MSTTESNIKNQPIVSTSASSSSIHSGIPPPLLLPTATPLTATPSVPLPPPPPPPTPFYDDKSTEKFYKKEKQILLEFDQLVKGRRICSSCDL